MIRRRAGAYIATFVSLCVVYLPLKYTSWSISAESHTIMECVATVLAVCVGALALVRFYSKKENTFLFIGTGFFVTGLLESYHALVTVDGFNGMFGRSPHAAIEWSSLAAPLFLSIQLWLSWLAGRREQRLGEAGRISGRLVYAVAALGAAGLFTFFIHAPLFSIYRDELLFSRPYDLIAAMFLLLALVGYLTKGHWRTDPFEHWLVLALIVGFVGQGLFMASSVRLEDAMFAAGHALKIAFYGCAFIGLLANMRLLYSESAAPQELALKNVILATQQETSREAILVVDGDDRIISCNRRFIELWGLPEDMVRRRDDRPVLAFVRAQVKDGEAFVRRIRYLYEHKSEQSLEEIYLKDGRILERYSAPMIGPDGVYYGRVWYFRDITEKKRSELAIRESEEKFRGLVDQSLVGIALIDEGRFSYVNHKFAAIFGYDTHEMARLGPSDIASDRDKAVVTEALRRQLHPQGEGDEFTFQGVRRDGAVIELEGRSARMHVSGKLVLMVIVLDITARVQAEGEIQQLQSQLREQAIRDPLTGLYNRRYLAEALRDELARAARGDYPVTVVMGDIDHFKVINDTYGHLAGDRVLRTFGTLIKTHSRAGDVGCRYGGEEFLVVMPGMTKASAVERVERLRRAFADEAMPHDDFTMHATASFGVAVFPDDGSDVERLVNAADEALYTAKRAGRNRVAAARTAQGEHEAAG